MSLDGTSKKPHGQELLNIIYIAVVMPISRGNFDSLNTCNLKYGSLDP